MVLTIVSPRSILKEAYAAGIIDNPDIWNEAVDSRNLMSHIYDEETAISIAPCFHRIYYSSRRFGRVLQGNGALTGHESKNHIMCFSALWKHNIVRLTFLRSLHIIVI